MTNASEPESSRPNDMPAGQSPPAAPAVEEDHCRPRGKRFILILIGALLAMFFAKVVAQMVVQAFPVGKLVPRSPPTIQETLAYLRGELPAHIGDDIFAIDAQLVGHNLHLTYQRDGGGTMPSDAFLEGVAADVCRSDRRAIIKNGYSITYELVDGEERALGSRTVSRCE